MVKLDQVIRSLESRYPLTTLESMPKWHSLLKMHDSLKGMLPEDYSDISKEAAEEDMLAAALQDELIEGTNH